MYTFNEDLKKKLSPQHTIAMFAHHINESIYFPTHLDISEAALTIFIESNRYARVMDFSIDSATLIFGGMRTALFLFYHDDPSQKNMMDAKSEFQGVATYFE